MKTRIVLLMAIAAFTFTATTAEAAGTLKQQCLRGRAKAQGRYQSCVQKAHARIYGGGSGDDFEATVSMCRTKYAAAWDKLVKLDTAPCAGNRWVDNGLTVTDNLTGLIWEKKTNLNSVPNADDRQDADNTYTWTTSGDGDITDEDGTAFTDFLANVNAGAGFAGANGWRMPTVAELVTILLPETYPCATSPCIDSSFGPTATVVGYWSATIYPLGAEGAWLVLFGNGYMGGYYKDGDGHVRAVRGGS